MLDKHTELRAFRQEYLDHALAADGWPPKKVIHGWRSSRNQDFMRNGEYGNFKQGEPGKPSHARLIVQYLVHPTNALTRERAALNEFLAKNGVTDPATADEETVYQLITIDVLPDDGIMPGVLYWIFSHIVDPIKYVRPFEDDEIDQVREAAGWVCIEAGRQLSTANLEPLAALKVSEARMNISVVEYQKRVLEMWIRNRWSVVKAMVGDEMKGVIINNAVTRVFYERHRSGLCKSFDCGTDDLRDRSRWIVVEGMAPYPYLPAKKRHPGLSMVMAAVCQQARLSDLPGCPAQRPLNLLTFSATPVGTARAKRFGYEAIGTKIAGTDIELLERTLDLDSKGRMDAWLVGIWQGLQRDLRIKYPAEPHLVVEGLEDQPLERPVPGGLPVTC